MKPFMRSSKAGFTLVELIIVIAILAILAGVAIPVYSGYIKKANQAADNVLLDALNTAFQAASVEGGQFDGRPVFASALLGSDGSVSSVKSSADKDGSLFAKYFAGNQGSKFKTYVLLRYVKSKGLFEGYASGEEISVPYGDDTITVSAAEVAAFQASGFASLDNDPDADAITELMGEVDNVTVGAAQVLSTSARTTMLNDVGFSSFLAELGYTAEEIEAMKGSSTNTELGNKLANAMVLYTASKTKNLTASEIIEAFNAGSGFSTIANLNNGITDFATYSTIPYAMMLAYVNSEYAEGQQVSLYNGKNYIDVVKLFNEGGTYKVGAKKVTVKGSNNLTKLTDVTTLQNYICNSEGFIAYMQTDQAQADLSGFLSAMTMLDNNRSSLGEQNISSILSDGFTNQTLINMLNSALGF